MTKYAFTTQKDLTAAFWEDHPHLKALKKKTVTHYSGNGRMWITDIRCAFNDWLDYVKKSDMISDELADRATLTLPKTRKRK